MRRKPTKNGVGSNQYQTRPGTPPPRTQPPELAGLDDEDAELVATAFDPAWSEWAKVGITSQAAARWEAYETDPFAALAASWAGITLAQLDALEVGPRRRLTLMLIGTNTYSIVEWRAQGFTANDIVDWVGMGFDLDRATGGRWSWAQEWKATGLTPRQAVSWAGLGLRPADRVPMPARIVDAPEALNKTERLWSGFRPDVAIPGDHRQVNADAYVRRLRDAGVPTPKDTEGWLEAIAKHAAYGDINLELWVKESDAMTFDRARKKCTSPAVVDAVNASPAAGQLVAAHRHGSDGWSAEFHREWAHPNETVSQVLDRQLPWLTNHFDAREAAAWSALGATPYTARTLKAVGWDAERTARWAGRDDLAVVAWGTDIPILDHAGIGPRDFARHPAR